LLDRNLIIATIPSAGPIAEITKSRRKGTESAIPVASASDALIDPGDLS
jgi:hypothetical protein